MQRSKPVWLTFCHRTQKEMFSRMTELLFSIYWKLKGTRGKKKKSFTKSFLENQFVVMVHFHCIGKHATIKLLLGSTQERKSYRFRNDEWLSLDTWICQIYSNKHLLMYSNCATSFHFHINKEGTCPHVHFKDNI